MRYLFASLYVEKHNRFPRLKDYARHSKDLITGPCECSN